jgi:hypothetical protein
MSKIGKEERVRGWEEFEIFIDENTGLLNQLLFGASKPARTALGIKISITSTECTAILLLLHLDTLGGRVSYWQEWGVTIIHRDTWVISEVLHTVFFLFKNEFILQNTFTGLQCNFHCALSQWSNVWASLVLLSGRLRCWCVWLLRSPH